MTKHEARVALARVLAKDLLQEYLNEIFNVQYNYNVVYSLSDCLKFYLRPFFESDDIEDVEVKEMKSIDHFYPILDVITMPKRRPIYVTLDSTNI